MFFETKEWSRREVRVFYIISALIYLLFSVVCPAITIVVKYKMFQKGGGLEFNGFLLIVIIVFAFIGLRKIKKMIGNYNPAKIGGYRAKMVFELLYSLMLPCIAIVVLLCMRDNFKLAFSTAKICVIFFVLGILFDYLVLKFIEREMDIRHKADEREEIEARLGR